MKHPERLEIASRRKALETEWHKAEAGAAAAAEKLRRLTLARTAAAPGVSLEDVGRAACEALLCRTEADEAKADFLKI